MKWDEMSPRERDALVAEKVMGWTPAPEYGVYELVDPHGMGRYTPNYTTDISAAWEVFDKMQEHCDFGVVAHKGFGDIGYTCQYVTLTPDGEHEAHEVHADGETAPKAICLAALRAVGVEV